MGFKLTFSALTRAPIFGIFFGRSNNQVYALSSPCHDSFFAHWVNKLENCRSLFHSPVSRPFFLSLFFIFPPTHLRAYEHAATDLLENTFLPLFYQSDDYFRMLCGDRQRPIASSSSFSSSSSSRHSKSLSRAVNGIDGNYHLGTSSSSSLKPSPSVSKIGSKIKGWIKNYHFRALAQIKQLCFCEFRG